MASLLFLVGGKQPLVGGSHRDTWCTHSRHGVAVEHEQAPDGARMILRRLAQRALGMRSREAVSAGFGLDDKAELPPPDAA